jgi:hypothetical protein
MLTRMQSGEMPDETRLSLSGKGDLAIDFVTHRAGGDAIDAAALSNA